MTTTSVTGSLLETFREKSVSKDFYSGYEFRKELERLLEKKYNPINVLTVDEVKRLAEFEKYFTWEENFSLYFSSIFYVEQSPTLRVEVKDRDSFIKLLNDDELEVTLEEEIDTAINDCKYNGDLDVYCEQSDFEEGVVSVYQFELKPEFKINTVEDSMKKFKLIFGSLNYDQKMRLSSISPSLITDIFTHVTQNWKTEENIT